MRTARLVMVVSVALVASCSSRKSPSVVGKWLTPTGGSVEFRADGTALMAGPSGSREVSYRLADEQTIEFSMPGGKATVQWKIVSLGAKEMVIKDLTGAESKLRRKK